MSIPFRTFSAILMATLILISSFPVGVLATEDPPSSIPTEETLPSAPTDPATSAESPTEDSIFPPETMPAETLPVEIPPKVSLPEESLPEETLPAEIPPEASEPVLPLTEPESPGPGLYFGLLHSHSSLSDGTSSAEALFAAAAEKANLDFFAVTDFSDSLDHHLSADIGIDGSSVSADWAAGKAAAANATTGSFIGLFSYEMDWPRQMKLGHISTFGTPGFLSTQRPGLQTYDTALQNYYSAIASIPGSVSQFSHPGNTFGTFRNFSYDIAADRSVTMLEIDFAVKDPLKYYLAALDAGWHLAPTAAQSIYSSNWSDNGTRTAVYAQALTEAGILDALGNCRAYATEDPDLEISYSMDGRPMGSRLALRHVGDSMDIAVSLRDPTDTVGTIDVLTSGGSTVASGQLDAYIGTVDFSIPTASGYYFLKITQPDGDIAVTAPIWVDAEESLGIASLTCQTPVPIQYEDTHLTAALYNGEPVDFLVESLELLSGGQVIFTDTSLNRIPRQSTPSHTVVFRCGSPGLTTLTLRLKGTLEGAERILESTITLSFHQSGQVTAILADSSHGNTGLDQLTTLRHLAEQQNIRFTVPDTALSAGLMKDCRLLLVTAPTMPFSDAFLSAAADYAAYGGSLLLCGRAGDPVGTAELNRLLLSIGSSLRLNTDSALDHQNNGGQPQLLYTNSINRELPLCENIAKNQMFCFSDGCTIDPGNGTWIIQGLTTTQSSSGDSSGPVTLMAQEDLSGGGNVYAAGNLFFRDPYMAEPKGLWDTPWANRTIAMNLLGLGSDAIALSTIEEARACPDGTLVRIRGYVTAGNSNPYTTFPDTLYLQDETGGIAVAPFSGASVQQGTPMEITGAVTTQTNNRVLHITDSRVLSSPARFCPPETGDWPQLLDTGLHGGSLVEVEGTCLEVYCREDNTVAGCLLEDKDGNQAIVSIDATILNGSDGRNDLHLSVRKGRTISAMGLLHQNEYGDTVIRVRNCEEVVWVPPRTYVNPRTSDPIPFAVTAMLFSAFGLHLVKKRKKS